MKVGAAATIDVEANPGPRDGRTVMEVTGDVRLTQLELIGEGDDWTPVELAKWLDRELHRGDSFSGPSAQGKSAVADRRSGNSWARGRASVCPS